VRLSDLTQGRDNNFNVIRMLAASSVLVSHSFALTTGSGDAEPLKHALGMTLGDIAVDIFFVASGFLVSASLLHRRSVIEFTRARFLRIFPALAVAVLLSVFALGISLTDTTLGSYFGSRETTIYLAKNLTLFFGVAYNLPGVFAHNPWRFSVNGSLWTLPFEVRMYAILAIIWSIVRSLGYSNERLFGAATIAITILSGSALVANNFLHFYGGEFLRLLFMFFSGVTMYSLRSKVELNGYLALALFLVLAGFGRFDIERFHIVYLLALPYLILYCAYVPSGEIRRYNSLGDYSYGIYIFAYPLQQTLISILPGMSPMKVLTLSAPITLVLAILSWHFVEHPALRLKAPHSTRLQAAN